MKNEIKPCNR